MKIRKILSALLTAAICAATLMCSAVPAGAASAKKLLTVSLDKISKSGELQSIGNDVYITDSGFIRIGEKELKKWRKNGKLKPTKIKADVSFDENSTWIVDLNSGNYFMMRSRDSYGNRTASTVLKYDKSKNKISKVREYKDNKWRYCTADGYVINDPVKYENKKMFTITVDAPDGKQFTTEFSTDLYDNGVSAYVLAAHSDKYLYYTYTLSGVEEQPDYGQTCFTLTRYLVDKQGNKKKIEEVYTSNFLESFGDGFLAYGDWWGPKVPEFYLFLTDSGKTIPFGDNYSDYTVSPGDGIITFSDRYEMYGDSLIAYYSTESGAYRLLNIKDDGIKGVGGTYQYMYTSDGKIFLVKNFEGKWGFMNSSGKELAWFDDAGRFIGDYAPVVKDGKAYLVDRKMKTVSKKIRAEGVTSYGEGLYYAKQGNKAFLFTYK